jgi:hypothetical protein
MTAPTLTITIDRTSLGLTPLVLSGASDGVALGIVSYQEPADIPRYLWAPDSVNVEGSELISASSEQANLGFDWVSDAAANEAAVASAKAEVLAAVRQFSFQVTTQVSDAPAEVWAANRGAQTPSPRTYEDLANHNPVFAVTIPVYPIPGSA